MIGRTVSHYKITAKLGEGGMGEVYRARDTKLGREVAIKVLPEAFTADPERSARFEREARVLASLNHPSIAGIHQVEEADGLKLLVMELVEGEDLAARLDRGPVPLEEAVGIALEISEALEYAHERGIVHRDLKPANIKIAPDGRAKVLDFGLAKALEAPAGDGRPDLSMSPTLTAGMTGAGVLLGTAAYMSPEQAKGLESDRRADVWAFGVVVWEMLTGQRLFAGDSVSDTLAAVLRDEIDAAALPDDTPPTLRVLLARCLDRDPKSRLRDIGEARVALAALAGDGGSTSTLLGSVLVAPSEERAGRPSSSKLGWIVAAVMTAIALGLGIVALRPDGGPHSPIYAKLIPPTGADFDVGNGLALSPDGTRLAFTALDDQGQRALWVYSVDHGETERLKGTDGATYPFWSPDSRNLAFMAQGSLMRVAAAGGPTQTLATVREGRGGAWGPDGTIVFAPDFRGGLWRIRASGGEAVELTRLDLERREQAHRFPVFLPGGETLLFLAQTAEGGSRVDDSRIDLLDLASGERTPVLTTNSSMAYYASGGKILFWQDGSLMVAGLDVDGGSLVGVAVPLAEGIGYTGNEFATFSISQTGMLVYQSGSRYESYTALAVVDEKGSSLDPAPLSGEPATLAPIDYHQGLDLSHDGSRAVYRGPDNKTIWIRDLERGTKIRFTFEDGDHFDPVWSPDDEWIAYVTTRAGNFQLFRKPASGLGKEELIFESDLQLNLQDWSPDGRYLSLDVLDPEGDTDRDVALYDLEEGELAIVVQSPFFDSQGVFSPDGRWLAYASSDSGQFEIFVIPAVGGGGRFQVSTAGGLHPAWSPDGGTLYYVNPLVELMAVELDLENGVEIDLPVKLFDIRHTFNENRPFQPMPDGTSFLTAQLEREIRGGQLTLVQNWLQALPGQR